LTWETPDVTGDFVRELANGRLRTYKAIVQTGSKSGQSYYAHVLDLVFLFERLQPLIDLPDVERRCIYCACMMHDLNKVPPYNQWSGGRRTYADMVSETNVATELERLEADRFFRDWPAHLADIVALAHLHQGNLAITATGLDRTTHHRFRLGWERSRRLGWLLYAVDTLVTSHTLEEARSKAQALEKINLFLDGRRQRWLTHRLTENRGLLSNVIHNGVVQYLREAVGALDLLYYPDGVAYLVLADRPVVWGAAEQEVVTQRIGRHLADLQKHDVAKFIKSAPWGIAVDGAALESGAPPRDIFDVVVARVWSKKYDDAWRRERPADIAADLRAAIRAGKLDKGSLAYVEARLGSEVLTSDVDKLRLGELAMAYRNFLNAHLTPALKQAKMPNGETRVYTLLGLPEEHWSAYAAVNSYRWGYFLASDCSMSLEDLQAAILDDLSRLQPDGDKGPGDGASAAGGQALAEYLLTALKVQAGQASAQSYRAHLRRYVQAEHRQCCLCSSAAPAEPWMAANAPPNVGVQVFSNRLEGGDDHEPKRHICPVCRAQYIVERLAWKSHRDKQGGDQTTFYLHLFPFSFFTQPLLTSWYGEVRRLRGQELSSFFVRADAYFRDWVANDSVPIQGIASGTMGVGLPELPEALGNTPVLPLHARGQGYGEQCLQALETAAVLARFFGCRVLLSRLPVPIVDLSTLPEAVLFAEGMPRNLGWLLFGAVREAQAGGALDAEGMRDLLVRLGHLHAIKRQLWLPTYKGDMVHDLATAAVDDPLGLYAAVDRILERKLPARTGGPAEWQAIADTRALAPHLRALVGGAGTR